VRCGPTVIVLNAGLDSATVGRRYTTLSPELRFRRMSAISHVTGFVALLLLLVVALAGLGVPGTTAGANSAISTLSLNLPVGSASLPDYTFAYSATVLVVPSRWETKVGQTMVVTTSIEHHPGTCRFAVLDVTLYQSGEDSPVFEYLSPQRVRLPGSETTFTLKAMRPGTISFEAYYYGEVYCFVCGCWTHTYETDRSELVEVGEGEFFFPLIWRSCAGVNDVLDLTVQVE
jgi:hypothetical protein